MAMGRPKGSVNKLGAEAKENVACAFAMIGGRHALAKWAEGNPTDFYRLYSKLIPATGDVTLSGNPEAPLRGVVELVRPD